LPIIWVCAISGALILHLLAVRAIGGIAASTVLRGLGAANLIAVCPAAAPGLDCLVSCVLHLLAYFGDLRHRGFLFIRRRAGSHRDREFGFEFVVQVGGHAIQIGLRAHGVFVGLGIAKLLGRCGHALLDAAGNPFHPLHGDILI